MEYSEKTLFAQRNTVITFVKKKFDFVHISLFGVVLGRGWKRVGIVQGMERG